MSSTSWVQISKPEPMHLKDIMKQETGQELQNDEGNNQQSDAELARILQKQFDEEQLDDSTKHECAIDSDDDDDLEQLSACEQWRLLDDVVKERSHSHKNTVVAKIPLALPRAYRHPIHNEEKHLKAETDLLEYTRIIINSLIKKKLFKNINGVVNIGHESVILHADNFDGTGNGLAVKVFNIYPLMCSDCTKYRIDAEKAAKKRGGYYYWREYLPKFSDCRHKLRTRNKVVHELAENETNNLKRYKETGIACPETVALKQHVIVMSFIGDNHIPASKLSDINFDDSIQAYVQITQAMKTLYRESNSVHVKLSEKNILWHDNTCYFIDIDKIIDLSDDDAFECLIDNCVNISKFFANKRKISSVIIASGEAIFHDIVGIRFNDRMELTELQKKFKQGRPRD